MGVQVTTTLTGSTTTDRVRAEALLQTAVELDASVSGRTLEFWRAQGLMPRPERSGQDGKRPVWTYPRETVDQLRALLQWRRKTKDLNALRAALWYDGYPLETARVRDSMAAYLRQLMDAWEKEIAKRTHGTGPEARREAIQSVAGLLAAKRGNGFPRLSRQTLSARTTGLAMMLGLVLDGKVETRDLEPGASAAERLIGLDRGRRFKPRGAGPWLDGPPEEGLEIFAQIGGLPRLLAVLAGATDTDLEVGRDLARTLLTGLSEFSMIADAFAGRDNASGLGAIRLFAGEPSVPLVIVPLVLSVLRAGELAQNLTQVLGNLEAGVLPVAQRLRELAALPAGEQADRLKNLSGLPFSEQLQIRRLLAEFGQEEAG